MSSVVPPRRTIVLKADRDTLMLLAAASGLALAIGYSVHSHPAPQDQGQAIEQAAGEWAGRLAELPPPAAINPAVEPLSSDALTVPKAAMALPVAPRPAASAKLRICDGALCPAAAKVATNAAPAPIRRPAAPRAHPLREASLMDRLNPLNHLPEVVTRPFASAGDTITSWVKRF